MDKIKVFETIGSFIETYGWSFLILIGMGFLIALLCEAIISIKRNKHAAHFSILIRAHHESVVIPGERELLRVHSVKF